MQVVALVFITNDAGLLLVEQNSGQKYWSLPGGRVESNETIEQAAIREVKEETGLEVRLSRTIGIYLKPEEDGLAITFEGHVEGGILRADAEIRKCEYFPTDRLPSHIRDHFWQRLEDFAESRSDIAFRTQ